MSRPWTVDLTNLAAHAVPLGAAINRFLWRWSPWHLRYERDLFLEASHDQRRRAARAKQVVESLTRFIKNSYPKPLPAFDPSFKAHTSRIYDVIPSVDIALTPEQLRISYRVTNPQYLRDYLNTGPLLETMKEEFARAAAASARKAVDAIKDQLNVQLASP